MAKAVIALGSNLGDRQAHLAHARRFLSTLGSVTPLASSIYETEPVGDASTHSYFNAVCEIETELDAMSLLEALKAYEREYGRDPAAPRWSNRTIDLDIIDYDRQIIVRQRLNVPHPEYHTRLFVLVPLREILPGWRDVRTGEHIDALIADSPKIEVSKTSLKW
jgi:2-amino-4-hydroxy-6-hydroxymethyldihydropteridine diphosphokinase